MGRTAIERFYARFPKDQQEEGTGLWPLGAGIYRANSNAKQNELVVQ